MLEYMPKPNRINAKVENFLERRWNGLLKDLNRVDDGSLFKEIVLRYKEKSRYYHTLDHIFSCFNEFDEIRHMIIDPLSFALGLIVHDIYYDPKKSDKEIVGDSVQYVSYLCSKLNLSSDFEMRTRGIVQVSDHKTPPKTIDEKFAVDIDLSILGQDEKVYDEYVQNIRKEYSHIGDEDFRKGRAEILQYFFDRSLKNGIYYTQYFRDKYEKKARFNLSREIYMLNDS